MVAVILTLPDQTASFEEVQSPTKIMKPISSTAIELKRQIQPHLTDLIFAIVDAVISQSTLSLVTPLY